MSPLKRRLTATLIERLDQFPAVALLGPRQVGKTTLALEVAGTRPTTYLDLESSADRQKLADPAYFLSSQEDRLVILDEVQRLPELFNTLRGLIDDGRRRGLRAGRFLLLGSASIDLLRQSETLAGRIAYLDLAPLDVLEVGVAQASHLWVRGGFPDSFLAGSEGASLIWRESFIRTYLERDIPQLGPRIPATTLHRFWNMLAHMQGGLFNAAHLARGLAVDGKTIMRYLDLLVDLMLVRRLPPYHANVGKRLVKSPKIFVRDSGIVHALLGIANEEALLGHPVVGGSWEGFVIENLLAAAPASTTPFFYRTTAGAEIDLLLDIPSEGLWAIEIKRGLAARPDRGFYNASDDVQPTRRFIVTAGTERYPVSDGTEAIGLADMALLLASLQKY